MAIAEVYANIPIKSISEAYSYIIPEHLSFLGPGWRVLVPFGGRTIEGFIVSVSNTVKDSIKGIKLLEIMGTVDDGPWFSAELMEACHYLADFYLCSPAEIMRLFMPGKSGVKIQTRYEAIPGNEDSMILMVNVYRRVYELLLANGPMTSRMLKKALDNEPELVEQVGGDWNDVLQKLLRYKVIGRCYKDSKRAKAKYEKFIVLNRTVTPQMRQELGKRKVAQQKLLDLLLTADKHELARAELVEKKISSATVKALAQLGWINIQDRQVLRDSYVDARGAGRSGLTLSEEQSAAVQEIIQALENTNNQINSHKDIKALSAKHKTTTATGKASGSWSSVNEHNADTAAFLLYGVTGSGKTQVYIEAAKKARCQGRTVMVLVPEIALTGQLVQAFKDYFTDDIIAIHSRLSINERNDAIIRARQGEGGVIIGARSALFAPVDNIGLIIIDEEQDNSYKQDESPRYHARVVAEELVRFYHSVLILGSATPSMETFYAARQGKYRILSMTTRIGQRPLPAVRSVDMRAELKRGRRTIISQDLRQLIYDVINKGEQLIIMLNRRGFSTFIMCRSCGHVISCPDCGLPMTYHKDGRLLCHHCDIHAKVPDICPKCQSRYIKYFGSGTEKLEQELRELVPEARVIRMDRDTTTGKFSHAHILDSFRRHEYDILLGTQMVAKGHDIPNVTAVGIISADSALNIPDFRAAERVFMLITQTSGRAGRGEIPGQVIVQTYNPEHYAVTCGMAQNFESFYQNELAVRKSLFYPPFSRIVKLTFQDKNAVQAMGMARQLKELFNNQFRNVSGQVTVGPGPAMIANFRGVFRYVLIIKTNNLDAVRQFLKTHRVHLNNQITIDIDPLNTD